MASNGNGKTAETGTLSPRLSPLSLSPPRPIIDLPENKSDKSMSRRLGRDSPRGIAINNFYRGIKVEETWRRDRFRVRRLGNFHYSPDWNSSRRNLSRPVSKPLLLRSAITRNTVERKERGRLLDLDSNDSFPRSTRLNARPSCFLLWA